MPQLTDVSTSINDETTLDAIRDLFREQRLASRTLPTLTIEQRVKALNTIRALILENAEAIQKSICNDFGNRSAAETEMLEMIPVLNAIRYTRRNLGAWMRPEARPVDLTFQPGRAWIRYEPLGLIGIIAPWHYPLLLSLSPLVDAIAAGNRVMIKPSELTPCFSKLLHKLISSHFDTTEVTVVTGGLSIAREFARLPFDHLIFTGATATGREVMRAAAENLTPVTLELGGKSPAIIAPGAHLTRAAADIVYGKLLNSGQTCIAPDYVLVHSESLRGFVEALKKAIERYYPGAEYTSIINDKHEQRLRGYLDEARARGVETISMGHPPKGGRRLEPTILIDPPEDLQVMREEIFGPILPLKTYQSIDDAIAYVNHRPRPLVLYLFARDRRVIDRVLTHTVSGGVCINDTLLHIAAEDLPFGGVGPSGMGHYHGLEGFDTFSQLKPIFRRHWLGLGRMLRPPHSRLHDWM